MLDKAHKSRMVIIEIRANLRGYTKYQSCTPKAKQHGRLIMSAQQNVTVLFQSDPSMFLDPNWLPFYATCVRWINEAARKHGNGFSIKFSIGQFGNRFPVACVRWNTKEKCKEIWLTDYRPRVAVAFQEAHPALEIFDPFPSNWEKALEPLLLSHKEWRVRKLERDLELAKQDLARETAAAPME